MRRLSCFVVLVLGGCGAVDNSVEGVEARARAIHDSILTLDTHKDIRDGLATRSNSDDAEVRARHAQRCDPTVDGDNQVDFPKSKAGGYDTAFYIVYVSQQTNDRAGFFRAKQRAKVMFDAIHRMCDRYPEHIELARTPADVRRIDGDGKLVCCIGIENGYPMGEDLGLIEEFWLRGARYMSITHNRHNQLGDSHTPAEPLHGGLTDLGRQAVAKMNELGIMVDISHASKATVMDVFACAKAPVIASHSGCRAVNDHTRNLDDETLLKLKENGGVIQCVALGDFVKDHSTRNDALDAVRKELGLGSRWEVYQKLNGDEPPGKEFLDKVAAFEERSKEIDARMPKANVQDFVDHIDHAVQLIGIDHVAISSDFDGGGGIHGWNNAAETFNVTHELVRRGYTKEQIEQIWSGNTLRVWAEVERIAAKLQAGGAKPK